VHNTNLPLCNDTIIVLKIILLHSVSVITNFVVLKHDKKQTDRQKKHHNFLSTAGVRRMIPIVLRFDKVVPKKLLPQCNYQ